VRNTPSTRRTRRFLRRFPQLVAAAAWAAILVHGTPARATLTNVGAATDICSASSDPCVLTQPAEVLDGAVIDFGTRGFEIRSSGRLDVGKGVVTVRAGSFTVVTSGTAIDLAGPGLSGASEGGLLTIEVRRRCSGNSNRQCLADSDCAVAGAGTCTNGSGAASVGGKVIGNAEFPGAFVLRAAGPISVTQTVQMNGTATDSDGGVVEFDSAGSVTLSAVVSADSGGQGAGGEVDVTAGTDITISSPIDVTGGDFDGGVVDLSAGLDVVVTEDVNAGSTSGGGFGGEIGMDAGRDLRIDGGTALNRVAVAADGHESADLFGGDGGSHDYYAGRDIYFGAYTQLTSDGAPPDGFGDFVTVAAGRDVLIDGDISARARGTQGGGGELDLDAGGQVTISALSQITLTGGQGGGGELFGAPEGDLVFQGAVDATAGNGGLPGGVSLDSGADSSISGSIKLAGALTSFPQGFSASACRLQLLSGASIANTILNGRNAFVVRERMTLFAGAKVTADTASGSNTITYRTSAKPPVLAGTMTPAPLLKVDGKLPGCPVCGNKDIDAGETCDDGNRIGGDGCSADCQDEGCVAGTPGYPSVPLCDDGDPCTADACDTQTHACTHVRSCDDGIDCTIDTCLGDACAHTPNDALCGSETPCAVGFCNSATGCVFEPVAGRCSDGLFCNGADQCANGTCSVHTGDPCAGNPECRDLCDESADRCQSPVGTPCSSDGRQCTADFCNGVGSCIHPDQSGPCDDGVFCNGMDFCLAGDCNLHSGDPCAAAGECRSTCEEAIGMCTSEQGIPCSDDGNFCTDDLCDGAGDCGHVPYAAFSAITTSVVRKGGPDNDRFLLKASFPAADLTASPTVSGLRFEILDDAGASVFSCDLPAASFSDVKGDGSRYRFRDKTGTLTAANGVYLALVRRNVSKGIVGVRLKGRGHDVPAIVGKPRVSAALGFGTQAGSPCVAGVALSCAAHGSRVSCGN